MFLKTQRGVIVVLILLLLIYRVGASSNNSDVTVEIYPSSLRLPAHDYVEATLVLRSIERQIIKAQVNYHKLPGVKIEIEPDTQKSLPLKGALSWKLKLSREVNGIVSGDINFQDR